MPPARQNLEAGDLAGAQVYLRLEEGQELLVLQAEANALLDLAMGQQSPLHRGIEPDRADGPARLGMVERDVGAAEQVRHADLRRGGGGHAGEGADLDHLSVNLERTRRQSKQPLDHLFRLLAAIGGKKAGNGELVAARACDHGALARILEDGAGHAAKQRIARVIAVPVVDRPEAMKLQGNDQQRSPVLDRLGTKLVGAVREALSVQQAGDCIGRCRNRSAALAVEPAFGFMLQIHVPTPAEEDQRDVERQRDRGNLHSGPDQDFGAADLAEEGCAVADKQDDGRNDGSEHDPVVPRTFQRRARSQGEPTHEHKA